MFLSIRSYDTKTGIRIFKPLAILRILRLVNVDTGMPSILRGLKYGIPQLVNVSSMLVYFWIFFGILGVQIFRALFEDNVYGLTLKILPILTSTICNSVVVT